MNYERQRQMDAHKARMARMGIPTTPKTPVVAKPPPPAPKPSLADRLAVPTRPVVYLQFNDEPMKISGVIVNQVCDKHALTAWQIKSPGRTKNLVAARFEAAYRLYAECPHLSLTQIGKILRRDHTSIIHAITEYARRNDLPMPRRKLEIAA
jgi:hypothetical protein